MCLEIKLRSSHHIYQLRRKDVRRLHKNALFFCINKKKKTNFSLKMYIRKTQPIELNKFRFANWYDDITWRHDFLFFFNFILFLHRTTLLHKHYVGVWKNPSKYLTLFQKRRDEVLFAQLVRLYIPERRNCVNIILIFNNIRIENRSQNSTSAHRQRIKCILPYILVIK